MPSTSYHVIICDGVSCDKKGITALRVGSIPSAAVSCPAHGRTSAECCVDFMKQMTGECHQRLN